MHPLKMTIGFIFRVSPLSTLTVDAFANHVISVRHRRRFMKVNFPDKHAQIVRMGTKNSEQKGAAKVVSLEVESQYGRRHFSIGQTTVYRLT